jgi:hypothetical protein
MERIAWTDERLDDLARRIHSGFGRVDADIRELRLEIHSEVGALRAAMVGVAAVMTAAMLTGFLGVIAAMLARG